MHKEMSLAQQELHGAIHSSINTQALLLLYVMRPSLFPLMPSEASKHKTSIKTIL